MMREPIHPETAAPVPAVQPDDDVPVTAGFCVRVGLFVAAGLSVLSTGILAIGMAVVLVAKPHPVEALQMLLAIPVVAAGYFAAGALGGLAFRAVTPLRRWVIGWVLTGILVAGAVYGSVAATAALAYVFTGLDIIGFASAGDAWDTVRVVTIYAGIGAGVPGGLIYWWKEGRRRPWRRVSRRHGMW